MTSQHGPRGRNSDPFAGFRSGGTTLRTDDRLDVDTYDDEAAMHPPRAVRTPPSAADHAPPVPDTRPEAGAARPRTRREAREAQARLAAPQQDHPQQDQWSPAPAAELQPPRQHPRASLVAAEQPQARGTDIDWSAAHHGAVDHADHHAADHYAADQYAADYPDGYVDHYDDGDDDPSGAGSMAMGREGRRRGRGSRRVLVMVAVLAAVGLGSYFAWSGLQPAIQAVRNQFAPPPDFTGPGAGEAVVRVEQGETASAIGQKLLAAGVVQSEGAFVDAAKANPDWTSVQVGDYRLLQQMPAAAAVAALLDTENMVLNRVTIREGLRTVDILADLSEQTGIPVEEFTAAALALPLPPEAALNLPPEQRPPNTVGDTEGWLFPETYDLGFEPTAASILEPMLDRTLEVLTQAGVPRDQWQDVLTKASLVQAEARLPEDFGKVARVTENRLTAGVPTANGAGSITRIQYDSTTIYAAGKASGVPTKPELDSLNPYNTRAVDGMPPGPISHPGLQAIEAVLSPTPGDWLYFTTVNLCTGETRFEVTAEEARADAALFKAWAAENQTEDGIYNCG